MSDIKDLFNSKTSNKLLEASTQKEVGSSVESADYLKSNIFLKTITRAQLVILIWVIPMEQLLKKQKAMISLQRTSGFILRDTMSVIP